MTDTMKLVVTTIYRPAPGLAEQGRLWASRLQVPFVARNHHSLLELQQQYDATLLLVATQNGPVVHTAGGEFFFHLNMAALRIKNLINGNHDHMITAMQLTAGMSVLDCTVGLGSDAIVASFVTGAHGRIVGLEASTVMALVTEHGLQCFVHADSNIRAALRRITVRQADYSDCLNTLPDDSFDIVYFDPMFRDPIQHSSHFKPIRCLAEHRPLSVGVLQAAARVAKQRVVVKETRGSPEFLRLGISQTTGGKYSSIHYGWLNALKGGAGWNS